MKLLRRTLITINGVLIFGLLFGFLRQYTDPGQASFLTIFSLLYPYTVLLLSICLILLLILRSRWFWASLVALVLTSGITIRQIGFHIQPDIPADSTVYSISTLNIKNNFRHKKKDQSVAFIEDFKMKNPTFLVLQEISGDQIGNVAKALNYPYDSRRKNQISNGFLAIFSQYPITSVKPVKNGENRVIALIADIDIPEGTIRLINIHLHTNAVTVRAGNFSPESFSRKEGLRAFNDMLSAYSKSASQRMEEIELIKAEMTHSPFPVILAGDANDTPYSPVYLELRGEKQNAFVKGGLGFAQTYNGLIIPLKIDHIFFDNRFFIYNTTIEKIDYSDHNPITTSFSLQK